MNRTTREGASNNLAVTVHTESWPGRYGVCNGAERDPLTVRIADLRSVEVSAPDLVGCLDYQIKVRNSRLPSNPTAIVCPTQLPC